MFLGKFKPNVPEDDEQADLFTGSDGEGGTGGEGESPSQGQGGYTSYQDGPVTDQPGAAKPESAGAAPVFAMPPPPAYETSN